MWVNTTHHGYVNLDHVKNVTLHDKQIVLHGEASVFTTIEYETELEAETAYIAMGRKLDVDGLPQRHAS
jgi:hypothetical protein